MDRPSQHHAGTFLAIAALLAALLAGFSGLVADPDALIVDGECPWVDEGIRPGARPIGNDLTGLFLPRHLWLGEHWRRTGRIPQWDPRGFAGRPNVGNPQAGAWYPPSWAMWSWGDPSAPGWLTVAHLLWAGAGTFALGRAVGLGRGAATVSGVVLMLNPYGIAQVHEGHLPHVWSASWYPWALLGAIRLRRESRDGRVLLPVSLAMSVMAGHPQEGMYLALALVGWAAFDVAKAVGAGRTGLGAWRVIARWAVAIGMAAGLSAVEWVPDLMARRWVAGPLGGAGGGGSGPYHLHPSNLLQLVSPRALGGPSEYFGRGNLWENLLSIGWAPLVLAVTGVAGHPDRRGVRGWSLLLGLSVAHASGDALGLSAIVAELPGMGGLRVPSRSLFLAATASAVLAGMGVEAMARAVDRGGAARRARRLGVIVGLLGVFVATGAIAGRTGGLAFDRTQEGPAGRWASASVRIACDGVFLGSLAATGAAIAWGVRRPGDGRRIAGAIGASAVVELAASAAMALPICPAGAVLGPDAVGEAIARVRPEGPFRVRARDAFYPDLHAWRDGVEKTNLGDLFQLRHAAEVYRALYPLFDDPGAGPRRRLDPSLARSALDRLGVVLVVGDRPLRMAIGPEVASGTRGGTPFTVVANAGAMPRAYVVPGAAIAEDDEALRRLPLVDPRSAVLMAADPLDGVGGPRQGFTPADYDATDPDRVVVRVSTEAPGLLVVTDAWMPGWSATVDGRPSPVLRGDHAFRVVPLPAPGNHEVVMSYRAPGLSAGAGSSAVVAVILAGMAMDVGFGLGRRER